MQSYYSTIILDPPLHPPTTCTIKCSRRRGITAELIQLLGAQQHLTPLKTPFRPSTNSLCEYVCTSQSTKKCLFRPHFATINEKPGPLKHCISRPQTAYRKARIKLTPFMFYSFSHQSHLLHHPPQQPLIPTGILSYHKPIPRTCFVRPCVRWGVILVIW